MREIQHFGLTISNQKRSRRFYSKTLRLPWLAQSVNRGRRCEKMHGIPEIVNVVSWYQIGDSGVETFYLPRHPSPKADVCDARKPGWRYISFLVDGFDDYARRLNAEGFAPRFAKSASERCLGFTDPDGIRVLLFDSGVGARIGRVTGLKEIGLIVASTDDYSRFFDAVGLGLVEEDAFFLEDVLGLGAPAPLYGHVRLIRPPDVGEKVSRSPLSDVGIKHVAYYVDDVDAFYKKGRDSGLVFSFAPVSVPGGSRLTYFLDPEGNTFEVMQVRPVARAAAHAAGSLRQAQMDLFAGARRVFENVHG